MKEPILSKLRRFWQAFVSGNKPALAVTLYPKTTWNDWNEATELSGVRKLHATYMDGEGRRVEVWSGWPPRREETGIERYWREQDELWSKI